MKFTLALLLNLSIFSLFASNSWTNYRDDVAKQTASISGWCSRQQAILMMDVIHQHKCRRCVEIGVFAGASLYPIAKALQYNGFGKVYAIDAWDLQERLQEYDPSDPKYQWWAELDMNSLYQQSVALITKNKLNSFCNFMRHSPRNTVNLFVDESIDFIHFDGTRNEERAFRTITTYFPKVRDGGFILLKRHSAFCMRRALVYLLERTEVVSSFEPPSQFLLLRKSAKRIAAAQTLINP